MLNSLLEKGISFCSSFRALSTGTSFVKIGVCYQKVSTTELNFHYRLSIATAYILGQIVNICERCEHAQNDFEPSARNWH